MSVKGEVDICNPFTKIIEENREVNLVTVAYSPWHAISIDALILYLQDKGVDVRAGIVIAEHPQTGFAIDETYFCNDCSVFYNAPINIHVEQKNSDNKTETSLQNNLSFIQRARIEIGSFLFVLRDIHQSHRLPIYYVVNCFHSMQYARYLYYAQNRHVILTFSDEGVASYMGTLSNPLADLSKVKSWQGLCDYFTKYVWDVKLYSLLHKQESSRLFKKSIWGNLSVNQEILPYYLKIFNKRNDAVNAVINEAEIADSVVICTTAWDRKQIKEDEDLRILEQVCDFLSNKNCSILLKTHPRDHFFETHSEDLHSKLLETNGLSMECLCAKSQPKAIISFSSTTLITAKLFWDIPVFCLSDLLNRSLISDFYLEEIDKFKKTFSGHVTYVKDLKQLESIS